ncbi:IS256 family transposase [Clostridium perfringens]|uniref:Probable transposase n=1 Tax=Clostridium perfringens (strain 13 / Type A) TaxID=195102 RepID=Q93ME2_CLOPE|nr:IS256 family transposase [Clostridium perfringens]BAB62443.1 probable transposase [Clostridium perfringens str. 13]
MISKHQRNINRIEDKNLNLYASGITTRDVAGQIKALYDIEISAETVSNITNRIMPLVSEW